MDVSSPIVASEKSELCRCPDSTGCSGFCVELAEVDLSGQVAFFPDHIFSKYGFDDGDLLSSLLHMWASGRGLSFDESDWKFIDSHVFLFEAYRRLVELPGWEPVMFISSSHNPVRAASDWYDVSRVSEFPRANEDPVLVPVTQLLSLAEELFPRRSRAWLTLYQAVFDLWEFDPEGEGFADRESLAASAASGLSSEDASLRLLTPRVDRAVAAYDLTEEELPLVAKLLKAHYGALRYRQMPSAQEAFDSMVSLCRAALG